MNVLSRTLSISMILLAGISVIGCTPVGQPQQTSNENTPADNGSLVSGSISKPDFTPAPESSLAPDYSDTSEQERKFAELQARAEQIGEKDWKAALLSGIKASGHPVVFKETRGDETAAWEGWNYSNSPDPIVTEAMASHDTKGESTDLFFDRRFDTPSDTPKVLEYVSTLSKNTLEELSHDLDICGVSLGSSPEDILNALGKPTDLWDGDNQRGDYCCLIYSGEDAGSGAEFSNIIAKFECLDGYIVNMYAGYTTEQLPSHEEHANVGTLVAQSEKQGDIPAWADIAINQTSINEHQVILGRTTEQGLKDTDYWQDDDSELMLKDDSILTDAMFGNVTDSLVSPQVVTSLESSCDPKEIPEDLTHAIDIGGIHLGASIEDVEKVLGKPTSSWDGDGTRGDYQSFQYLVAREKSGNSPAPFHWLALNIEFMKGKVFSMDLQGALRSGEDLPDSTMPSISPEIVYPEGEPRESSSNNELILVDNSESAEEIEEEG